MRLMPSTIRRCSSGPYPATALRTSASHAGRGLLGVATELLAHRRQQLVAVVGLAAGAEAAEQGCAQDVDRDALIDRRSHGPTTLARVGDASAELRELGRFHERYGSEIQQP